MKNTRENDIAAVRYNSPLDGQGPHSDGESEIVWFRPVGKNEEVKSSEAVALKFDQNYEVDEVQIGADVNGEITRRRMDRANLGDEDLILGKNYIFRGDGLPDNQFMYLEDNGERSEDVFGRKVQGNTLLLLTVGFKKDGSELDRRYSGIEKGVITLGEGARVEKEFLSGNEKVGQRRNPKSNRDRFGKYFGLMAELEEG